VEPVRGNRGVEADRLLRLLRESYRLLRYLYIL